MDGKVSDKHASKDPSTYNDPDAENSEQTEKGTQAQDLGEEALTGDLEPGEDSEHGGTPNPAQIIPDDVPDLVDKMNEMLRSGRIDSDSFEGEDEMDDKDGEDS